MEIKDLNFLAGKWHGFGLAVYPDIIPVSYSEMLTCEYDMHKDLLSYSQFTKYTDPERNGRTLHMESGFIRKSESGVIELSNAQNNGRVEVMILDECDLFAEEIPLIFRSKLFGNDPRMIITERLYNYTGSKISYEMKMATMKNPELSTHLTGELIREKQ
ncbi:MAG TPA: FABP family protein [Ignavibacteria bacterium]|nr:FABP family protein [Ignavibacteria bacterium]HMQ99334.1 FABP family protein [Ignavibacteria bacterium]